VRLLRRMGRWRFIAALAIFGPGFITANVDNDAGGIATYSLAGGNFGYAHLWALIPIGILLYVIQEMSGRLGAVTGKGLADLIRERFGLRLTFWLMIGLLFTNLANTMGEFAGIASASEIFGISRYIALPIAAALVWFIVTRGTYSTVEKVFLVACIVYVAYPVSGTMALLANPDSAPTWGNLVPRWSSQPGYAMMLVGIVGTTIAPWMQFYQQAAVADKGLTAQDKRAVRADVLVGCIGALIVVFAIVVTCAATIHHEGLRVKSVGDAAQALFPLAGANCARLFALGLLNASLFAASILPLATAYQVAEGMGWERGVDRTFREAPEFYTTYGALIAIGAGLLLIPGAPLLAIMYLSQVLNGVLLPVVLVFMLLLINNRAVMGEHTNSRIGNVVAGLSAVAVSCLVVFLAVSALRGELGS